MKQQNFTRQQVSTSEYSKAERKCCQAQKKNLCEEKTVNWKSTFIKLSSKYV